MSEDGFSKRDKDRVTRTLEAAWSAVEAAGIPESLHAAAFVEATRMLSEVPTLPQAPAPALSTPIVRGDRHKNGDLAPSSDPILVVDDEDSFYSTLASESLVDEDNLRRVYFVKEGRARIGLSKSRLGSTEAERNRSVATLMAGIRWYVQGRQSVLIGEIRAAAEAIPYEVSRNLSSHLESVPGTVPVGTKQDKAIRVQSGKFDEPYRDLINRLTAS